MPRIRATPLGEVRKVGGVFIAFLLPFLDLGITQSPMLHPEPTALARLLPGYGGSRVLLDGALTSGFDETRALVTGLVWLAVLGTAVIVIFHRATAPRSRRGPRAALHLLTALKPEAHER